ncbi:MAG: hypothetical protein K0Q79_255 [Flavipsychrobacter sp.]|nr:hypothetical protein [Flavipsychrobacter sp.]
MKKVLVFSFLFLTITASAQRRTHSKAPEVVRIAFYRQFPGIDDPRWEIEGGEYEAHFRHNGQPTSAVFTNDGKWVETERVIPINSLPVGAKLYIEKNFSGRNARHASVVKLANGETNYEAHINYMDLIFDKDGKYIRTEKD